MRVRSWLLLLVAFATGITSAFVVAYYTFDAKPVQVVDKGPTVKILVAKNEIGTGAEIAAQDVMFQDVPIPELPSAALTNFSQVYRRRPAFPIPAGCPLCEDLLIPRDRDESQEVKYLPAGSRIVSLELERVQLGESVGELAIPISNFLAVGDRIDIRVVPHEGPKGEFIERKAQVLKAFSSQTEAEKEGKLILTNIEIHQLLSRNPETGGGKQIQKLSLLLENTQADKLTAAARKGRLRVIPHSVEQAAKRAATPRDGSAVSNDDQPYSDLQSSDSLDETRSAVPRDHRIRLLDASRTDPARLSLTENGGQAEPLRELSGISVQSALVPAPSRQAVTPLPKNGSQVSFTTPRVADENDRAQIVMKPQDASGGRKTGKTPPASSFRPAPAVVGAKSSAEAAPVDETYSPFSTERRFSRLAGETSRPLPSRSRPDTAAKR